MTQLTALTALNPPGGLKLQVETALQPRPRRSGFDSVAAFPNSPCNLTLSSVNTGMARSQADAGQQDQAPEGPTLREAFLRLTKHLRELEATSCSNAAANEQLLREVRARNTIFNN